MAQKIPSSGAMNSRAYREAVEIVRNNDRENPLWFIAVSLVFGVACGMETQKMSIFRTISILNILSKFRSFFGGMGAANASRRAGSLSFPARQSSFQRPKAEM